VSDITCKETLDLEESRESKRRRVLEYPSESSQPEVGDHQMGSNFDTSEVLHQYLAMFRARPILLLLTYTIGSFVDPCLR
jgi:hypothetical protein